MTTMIRMIATVSAGQAKAYFTDALQPTDYYINKQELQGKFHGKLAELLNIAGPTTRESFFALCDNINPMTGKPLTPRTKDNRTICYDVSFHLPKSASLVAVLSKDTHIQVAFEECVKLTIDEMEKDLLTRVRRNGRDEDRHAGKLLVASFLHQTARPAKGQISDPHIHSHNLFFNLAWDEEERRFKAGQFREIARSLPWYQERFHKRMADKMMAMGYRVRKTKSAWEIENIDPKILDIFSKRSNEIGQFAKDHNITDARGLDQLGARTRGKKQKDLSMSRLKEEWRKQIRDHSAGREEIADDIIRQAFPVFTKEITPEQSVEYAAAHSFERSSTLQDRRLLESAYRFAVCNNSVTLDEIDRTFINDASFIRVKEGFQTICTRNDVLAEEREMVRLARNSLGKFKPLYSVIPEVNLEGQQKTAIETVLSTPNGFSIIRGAAGVGKTTALKELHKHLTAIGKQPQYAAPLSQTVHDVLRNEGFANAETVALVLTNKTLQNQLQDQVLIVDESGMLGTKDMRDLIALALSKNARLICLGDTFQHNSILRGDALRVLTKIGKIKPAEINKIRRQRNERYRMAVQDLAQGYVADGFRRLEEIEAVKQIDPQYPNAGIVEDYLQKVMANKSVLVIAPTHKQGEALTAEIRQGLQAKRKLGKQESEVLKLTNTNLTVAQKTDARNFRAGQVVQFNRDAPGIKRGSVWHIEIAGGDQVLLKNEHGERKTLPRDKPMAFDVFEANKICLAKGDQLRVTKNGTDRNDKGLKNGQHFEVIRIGKKGDIEVKNKESKAAFVLKRDFGHIDYAYCTTSHSSQGKTCDEVLISMPASTFPAIDAKLLYVAASRGRDMCTIYTDDKEQLLEFAERSGDRRSAMELLQRRNAAPFHLKQSKEPAKNVEPEKVKPRVATFNRNFDYEP